MNRATTINVSIAASADAVYAFAAEPTNLPRWAPNFGHAISRSGDEWVMETATGPWRVRFVERNRLGVLDHWVVSPTGETFHNPVRVIADGRGSLVLFTLFRQPSWSDERVEQDARLVAEDLDRLRRLVEAG